MKLLILLIAASFIVGAATASTVPNLNFSYYEGTWDSLPNFFALTPIKKGLTPNIDLSISNKNMSYAILWQGYITIKVSATYTFEINSDDGSKLYIGTYDNSVTPLINNNGVHASKTASGSMYLNAGSYPISLAYFQKDGGETMEIYWSSKVGLSREKIPDNAFSHSVGSLNYSYFEGSWNDIPDFNSLKPVKTGLVNNFDLGIHRRDTSYSVIWKGVITIPANGTYTFETSSDDGSRLYLDTGNTALVNNSGIHANISALGMINLRAGTYPITVSYFQRSGDQKLKVFWSSNTGITRQNIPDIAFKNPLAVVNYSYYEGVWNTLPDFNTLIPVKTGRGVKLDLSVHNRDTSYGLVWNGFIDIPASGTYTFETNSDDGSRLYLNNNTLPVVDNDGIHASKIATGEIQLDKGIHAITATYFQKAGGNTMQLYWSSSEGISRELIPEQAFVASTGSYDTLEQGGDGINGLHNYYFSTTKGDDSHSVAEAQDPATPWKTLNKLNSFLPNMLPGDAALFKRGDVFDGFINISKSGLKGFSLIFSAYGSGNKPIINGFATATGWSSIGGNIYESLLAEGVYLNCVTINDVIKPMGRYPNSEYLTVDSRTPVYAPSPVFTGPGTFTDAELPSSVTDWTGAEAVMRKNQYILDRCLITAHSGTTVSYISPSIHTPEVGFGYFIQNSIKTLDAEGEWYYDPIKHMLNLYTDQDPNTFIVKGSIISSLVVADNKSNLIFDNLQFQGADTSVFNFTNNCSDITIQKCDINFSGMDVLHGINSNYLTFKNNTVYHTNSSPVQLIDCSNAIISDNIIKNIGLLPGMGLSTFAGYGGIYAKGSNNTIERNIIDSVGYNGIVVTGGNNILVKNNFISNFCLIIADGGGIYTNGDDDFIKRQIIGNVVINGTGSYKGTLATAPRAASGIYLDELTSHVEVADNTVYNCVSNGIYLHQAYNNILRGNTLVDNDGAAISIVDDTPTTARIRNDSVIANIMYAKKPSQQLLFHGSTADDLTLFGRYDSNYYSRPFDISGYISTFWRNSTNIYSFYDLYGFRTVYYDRGIASFEAPAINEYTITKTGTNRIINGTFDANVNSVSTDANTNVTLDTKLDGNAAKFTNRGSPLETDLVSVIDIGPVSPGTTYRIKFSLIGSTNTQNLVSYIRSYNDPVYPIVSEIRHFPLRTTRTECEYVYVATTNEPDVKLTFVTAGNLLPYWIDNVEVTAVELTYTNIDDSIRFEYNPTGIAKTIALDGIYHDYKNNSYYTQVVLNPYSSILLMRTPAQNSQASTNVTNDSARASLAATDLRSGKLGTTELVTENIKALQNASVYPNPVVNVLATRLSTEKTGNISLIIHDGSGRIIQTANYFKKDMVLEKTVNVSTLRAGLYYLEIKFNDGTSVTKSFIKN